jgi:hypothetical protein
MQWLQNLVIYVLIKHRLSNYNSAFLKNLSKITATKYKYLCLCTQDILYLVVFFVSPNNVEEEISVNGKSKPSQKN